MPSFKTAFLALAAALVATVRADYYIVPDSVPYPTRQQWCQYELSTCPSICNDEGYGGAKENTCDPTQLTYSCLCSNNMQPNVSEYSLSLPYFTCTEWGNQCVTGCNGDSACQADCRQGHPCGALNPTRVNSTISSTMAATATGADATATGDMVYTGLGGSTATSTPQDNFAVAAFETARVYTLLLSVGALFAGFTFML